MPAPSRHDRPAPDFIYVTHIEVTPEAVWAALTSQANRPYWGNTRQETTFAPCAPMVWHRRGKVDVRGEILESEPPHRLVYTFHVEGPGPMHDEGPSVVEYLIEQAGSATRLKVIHANFPARSRVRDRIEQGWPTILSGLKSMLEQKPPTA